MHRRHASPRWALWAFAAALLLKAAMPWLASTSAEAQGRTLVEVCTVYGVSLQPLDGGGHAPAPDHAPDHGHEHCALSAMTVLAGADPAPAAAPAPVASAPAASHPASARAHDRFAAWVARLQHGPPALA